MPNYTSAFVYMASSYLIDFNKGYGKRLENEGLG